MTPEVIKAIGSEIVTPICVVAGIAIWLYFITKD